MRIVIEKRLGVVMVTVTDRDGRAAEAPLSPPELEWLRRALADAAGGESYRAAIDL